MIAMASRNLNLAIFTPNWLTTNKTLIPVGLMSYLLLY